LPAFILKENRRPHSPGTYYKYDNFREVIVGFVLMRTVLILFFVSTVYSCALKRPVLYPNYHLQVVGKEVAQGDIDECMRLAAEHGADSSAGGEVAKKTASGAAIGAATGAAVGAVLGHAARGAATGAAGGGAGGLIIGLFSSRDPDPVFRRFVEKCLSEKGYEPVGWR
jgi:outer membrane lipoprotein SlyB